MPESPSARWFDEWTVDQRQEYADRFRKLAASGQDIDGEARLVDALADRKSRILDAGCGSGRMAAYLAAQGHHALGVDIDPQPFRPVLRAVDDQRRRLDAAAVGKPSSRSIVLPAGSTSATTAWRSRRRCTCRQTRGPRTVRSRC